MAVITLAVQEITRVGMEPVYTLAGASPLLNTSDSFIFTNTGREMLHFLRIVSVECVVTFATPGQVDGLAVADRILTIPATVYNVMIGPFLPNVYNAPGGATLNGFTVSNASGLKLAILRLP